MLNSDRAVSVTPRRSLKQSWSRTVAALGLVLSLVLPACTADAGTPAEPSPAASGGMGEPAIQTSTTDIGNGVEVSGATEDLDTLIASTEQPPPMPDNAVSAGTPIELTTDGELSSPATITFTLEEPFVSDRALAEQVLIATWDDATETWWPVDTTLDFAAGTVSAQTYHLSWWNPFSWDWAGIGARINQNVGELVGKRSKPAECQRGEPVPDWVNVLVGISNESAVAIRACAEGEDGDLVVELVNNRAYGQQISTDLPVAWAWSGDGSNPLETNTYALVSEVIDDGDVYLRPRGRATIAISEPDPGSFGHVRIWPSGATLIADVAMATIGPIVEKVGKGMGDALVEHCGSEFIYAPLDVKEFTNPDRISDAILMVSSCLEGAVRQMVRDGLIAQADAGEYITRLKALKTANKVGLYLKAYDVEWKLADLFVDTFLIGGVGQMGNGFSVLAKTRSTDPMTDPGAAEAIGQPAPDPFGTNAPVVVVMDTSGSMSDTDPNGVVKIDGARAAVVETINRLPSSAEFALHVYPGGRSADGCEIGTTQIRLGPLDPILASAAVRRLGADGETPTGPAMLSAGDMLALRGVQNATMVLVSDGLSNCGPPPCEVAEDLSDRGINVINTVGFELDAEGESELTCIAQVTGGQYFPAQDSDQLATAIAAASQATLQIQVDPIPDVPVRVGTDSASVLRATVTNPTDTDAADVRVRLAFTDVPAPLLLTPVRRLGNLPAGQSRTIEFDFAAGPDLADRTVGWTVQATSTSAASTSATGTVRVVDLLGRASLGPLLTGVERVALLGDSYASGEGAGNYIEGTNTSSNRCHRSPDTHIAQLWGDDTLNLSCSGALTTHLYSRNTSNDEAPQLARLRQAALSQQAPQAAFVSIGGNDLGFADIIGDCLVFSDDCHDSKFRTITNWAYTGRAATYSTFLRERASGLIASLVESYTGIDRAINDQTALDNRDGQIAPIVVLPYPRILPRSMATADGSLAEFCTSYLSSEEVQFLNSLTDELNDAIFSAAAELQAQGRPVHVASDVVEAFQPARTMCEKTASAVKVPEGTSVGGVALEKASSDSSGWFHPNKSGYTDIARALAQWSTGPQAPATTAEDIGSAVDWDDALVAPPAFFAPWAPLPAIDPSRDTQQLPGGGSTIGLDGLQPGTSVHAWQNSSPRAVGTAVVDADGHADLSVTVPTMTQPGQHTITITGTSADRQPVAGSTTITVPAAQRISAVIWAALAGLCAVAAAILGWRSRSHIRQLRRQH